MYIRVHIGKKLIEHMITDRERMEVKILVSTIMCNMSSRLVLGFAVLTIFRLVESIDNNCVSVKFPINTTIYVGCEFLNWKGEKCVAFRGIPYAKPPIGERRFQDPLPVGYVSDIVDAQHDGKDCPSIFSNNTSEDCLYLNIYSKYLDNNTSLRSVIVFIHPGGFYGGSGSSKFFGPEYLLQDNIILVTFNYRLGSLGFLNLGTSKVPGNSALKDQVLALRWVKNNVQYFGGDLNNISLMGYSAGAMSVIMHLVSPMSRGLFHKAIIMSGSVPPQMEVLYNNQLELAKKQASLMGCEGDFINPDEIIECLNRFSGHEIALRLRKMFYFGKDNPIFLWLPIVEENFGQERFLIENPYTSLQAGRFSRVPILIGFTNGEFCTSAKDIIESEELLNTFNNRFKLLAPICFMYSNHKSEDEITRAIWVHYFQNNTINKNNFEQLCNLFSDSLIRFGNDKLSRIVSKYVEVYRYRFSYRGRFSNLNYAGFNAAEHMDDLMYIFQSPLAKFTSNDFEAHIVNLLTTTLTSFAKYGKLVDNFESGTTHFAEIHTKTEVKNETYFDKYDFWNNLTNL